MKRTKPFRWQIAVAGICLGSTVAWAEGDGGGALSPEMRRLQFLVGRWAGKVTEVGPAWTIDFREERLEITRTLQGRYLMLHSRLNQPSGPPFEVLQLLGYDNTAKRYRLWIFRDDGSPPEQAEGTFLGERLVLTGKTEVTPGMASDLGIQLEVKPTPEGWRRIYRVLPKGAAARAGLKSGDLIHRIEGRSVRGMPDAEVYRLLDGKPGTRVRLIVSRGSREADGPLPQEVTLTRQPFTLRKLPLRTTYEPRNPSGFDLVLEARIGEEWQRVAEFAHRPAPSSEAAQKP